MQPVQRSGLLNRIRQKEKMRSEVVMVIIMMKMVMESLLFFFFCFNFFSLRAAVAAGVKKKKCSRRFPLRRRPCHKSTKKKTKRKKKLDFNKLRDMIQHLSDVTTLNKFYVPACDCGGRGQKLPEIAIWYFFFVLFCFDSFSRGSYRAAFAIRFRYIA